jgi:hypothetical protein
MHIFETQFKFIKVIFRMFVSTNNVCNIVMISLTSQIIDKVRLSESIYNIKTEISWYFIKFKFVYFFTDRQVFFQLARL